MRPLPSKYDQIEQRDHRHFHECHICRQQFQCDEDDCAILDKYAVCFGAACIHEWDGYSADADGEDNWCLEDLKAGEPAR